MKQVNFNFQTTYETSITILDSDGVAVQNHELFIDIIDHMGFALTDETSYEIDYHGPAYTIIVENVREDYMFTDFEIY